MSEQSIAILGIFLEIMGIIVAMYIYVYETRNDRKAAEEQTYRENVRATLSELAELRRAHPNFKDNLEKLNDAEKKKYIRAYLTDLERFAVGCNTGAYDIEIVNKMSGGLLISQYLRFFKSYIEEKRKEPKPGRFVQKDTLYIEIEEMIKKICDLRGEDFYKL